MSFILMKRRMCHYIELFPLFLIWNPISFCYPMIFDRCAKCHIKNQLQAIIQITALPSLSLLCVTCYIRLLHLSLVLSLIFSLHTSREPSNSRSPGQQAQTLKHRDTFVLMSMTGQKSSLKGVMNSMNGKPWQARWLRHTFVHMYTVCKWTHTETDLITVQ